MAPNHTIPGKAGGSLLALSVHVFKLTTALLD